jgi:serine phosphatase RsbU (regulator of sigma subunit)/Tfp pilus assembly protein PilF
VKKLLPLIFLLFAFIELRSQDPAIDSLRTIIAKPPSDTALVNAWLALDNIIYLSDPAEDESLNKNILSFTKEKLKHAKEKTFISFYKTKQLNALNNLGIISMYRSDNEQAKTFFNRTLALAKELKNKQKASAAYNNFGILFYREGNYPKSIEYYTNALTIMESEGDLKGTAAALNNIGNIYMEIGDTAKALSTFTRSLSIGKKAGAKNWEAVSYSAIAEILYDRGKTDTAETLFKESMRLNRAIHNAQGLAIDLSNLSRISMMNGKLTDAKEKADSALMLFQAIKDQRGEGQTLSLLAAYYAKKNDIANALIYNEKALKLLMNIGQIKEAEKVAGELYLIYKAKSDYKKALEAKELYDELHEKILNEKNTKAILRQEFKYEYNKQTALDSIKHAEQTKVQKAELDKKDAELKVKRQIQISLFIGLALILVFSIFIFNRFKVTSRQNVIIEKQRTIVEEKNREIVDSINYAKRLQDAILPPAKLVKEYFPESFIVYKPKDIVAGDFYWFHYSEKSGKRDMENEEDSVKKGTILFAAADCTGHGVPGAMVSVICNNGLNRSVREYGLLEPGKILDRTREIVIQEFEKSETEVKDGMDISLCALQGKTLSWAGANNPLWIIRNNELIEYKGDKQPIGQYTDQKDFRTHKIELQSGDSIYLFTDGYLDQFGGEKGKKFKAANMKQLLLSIRDKNMEEQKQIVDTAFDNWKSNYEQVDDVCVIGIRV